MDSCRGRASTNDLHSKTANNNTTNLTATTHKTTTTLASAMITMNAVMEVGKEIIDAILTADITGTETINVDVEAVIDATTMMISLVKLTATAEDLVVIMMMLHLVDLVLVRPPEGLVMIKHNLFETIKL